MSLSAVAPAPRTPARRRRRRLSQAGWWGLGTMGIALPYALLVGGPHRTALVAISSGGLLMSVALGLGAWLSPGLVRRRRPIVLVYTAAHVLIVAALAVADGGASSPMALGFFGTVCFTAYTMPLALLPLFGALNVGAYLSVDIIAGSSRPGYVWVALAGMLATGAACAQQHHQLVRGRRALSQLARTDPLTGALNRRGFMDELERALGAAVSRPLTLLMLDLDDFKAINDRDGHAAGDHRLVAVAAALVDALGDGAVVGRLGGDEFAVLVPGAPLADERLAELEAATGASLGLARLSPSIGDTGALLAAADRGLYARKAVRRRAALSVA